MSQSSQSLHLCSKLHMFCRRLVKQIRPNWYRFVTNVCKSLWISTQCLSAASPNSYRFVINVCKSLWKSTQSDHWDSPFSIMCHFILKITTNGPNEHWQGLPAQPPLNPPSAPKSPAQPSAQPLRSTLRSTPAQPFSRQFFTYNIVYIFW